MADARARLKHLVDLAASGAPEDRARLVADLCELLLDWPADYPLSMRAHFDLLLEKAAEDVDAGTRATLATRFAAQPDAPIGLLNRLFFDAPDAVKNAILRRNALANDDAASLNGHAPADEGALIAAARAKAHDDLACEFARVLGVEGGLAKRILDEPSGGALAAACKGAHLKRTTFSALALLFAPETIEEERRLGAYDEVPLEGAESLVRFWREHPGLATDEIKAA